MAKIDPEIELLLVEAQRDKLYGSLEFKFEAGRFVIAKKMETIKPSGGREHRGNEVTSGN